MNELLNHIKITINDSLAEFKTMNLDKRVRDFCVEGRIKFFFSKQIKTGDKIKIDFDIGQYQSFDSDEDYSFYEFKVMDLYVGIGINASYPKVNTFNEARKIEIESRKNQTINLCVTWKNKKNEEDLSLWYLSDCMYSDKC